MGAQENLAAPPAQRPCQHLGKHADDFGMEGKFRLFQKEGTAALHDHPKKAHQAEGSVGELVLRLPGALGTPVLILPAQMGGATAIAEELDFFELGYSDAKGVPYPPEPGLLGICPCIGDLFEKVPSIRIGMAADRAVRLSDELRY